MNKIQSPKDFWAGALYIFVGVSAVVIASAYPFGSATRMGPGYFPTILGCLLALIGLISLVRAFVSVGEAVEAIPWKPLATITLGAVLFAYLLPRLGLPITLIILILTSATASVAFKINGRSLLAMLGLVIFCVVVFAKLLGVPLPLLGTWLGR